MIGRDLRAVGDRHDLIVVGGGILGAMTALAAARRGLRALLVERDDFGGGVTANSLRIVHGGVRTLQRMALRQHAEAVRERRFFLRAFPELVRPLPCALALDGRGSHRVSVMGAATTLHRALGGSAGVVRGHEATAWLRAPRSGTVSLATWEDAMVSAPGRLVVETLRWASAGGAVALAGVEALSPLVANGRIAGIAARDERGVEAELFADTVVYCGGGARDGFLAATHGRGEDPPPRAVSFNVLLARQPLAPVAFGVRARRAGPQTFFLVPCAGAILAGTCHTSGRGAPSADQVAVFVAEVAAAVPQLELDAGAVLRVLWGELPLARQGSRWPRRRAVVHHHAPPAPRGLHCAWAVKLGSARADAERLVRRIAPRAVERALPRPAPHVVGTAEEAEALAASAPAALLATLARAVHEEAARTADDLLLRRTDWGFDPRRRALLERALAPGLAALLRGGPSRGGG